MLSAISFGVFWRSALDQRDHAVEEGGAGSGGDAHADPVGQDLRAACHGGAVTARFPDDGRGFPRDGRLVDRGDALDHLAVGGDDVAGLDEHEVADLEAGTRDQGVAGGAAGGQKLGLRLRAGLAQGIGLRLAAPLGDGFGEVGEEHGEPEPEVDLEGESDIAAAGGEVAQEENGRKDRNRRHDEHDGIAGERARVQLGERGAYRRNENARIQDARGFCLAHERLQL